MTNHYNCLRAPDLLHVLFPERSASEEHRGSAAREGVTGSAYEEHPVQEHSTGLTQRDLEHLLKVHFHVEAGNLRLDTARLEFDVENHRLKKRAITDLITNGHNVNAVQQEVVIGVLALDCHSRGFC